MIKVLVRLCSGGEWEDALAAAQAAYATLINVKSADSAEAKAAAHVATWAQWGLENDGMHSSGALGAAAQGSAIMFGDSPGFLLQTFSAPKP